MRDAVRVRICLEHTPLAALARLGEIFCLEAAGGELWARPSLLKVSHAPNKALTDPVVCWLREHHPAFRATMDTVEERKGKVIVHENLLVARVSDLTLKVMLEKKVRRTGPIGGAGRRVCGFSQGLAAGTPVMDEEIGPCHQEHPCR